MPKQDSRNWVLRNATPITILFVLFGGIIVGMSMDSQQFAGSDWTIENYLYGVSINGQERLIKEGNPQGFAVPAFMTSAEYDRYKEVYTDPDRYTGGYYEQPEVPMEPVYSQDEIPDELVLVSSWGYASAVVNIDGPPTSFTLGTMPAVGVSMSNLQHVDDEGVQSSLSEPYLEMGDDQYHAWKFDVTLRTHFDTRTGLSWLGTAEYYNEFEQVSVNALIRIHLIKTSGEDIAGTIQGTEVLAVETGATFNEEYVYTAIGQAHKASPYLTEGTKVNIHTTLQESAEHKDYILSIGADLRAGFDYTTNWLGWSEEVNPINDVYVKYTVMFTTKTQLPLTYDESYAGSQFVPADALGIQSRSQWGDLFGSIFGGLLSPLSSIAGTIFMIIIIIVVLWFVAKLIGARKGAKTTGVTIVTGGLQG